jgi:hypothetical protein
MASKAFLKKLKQRSEEMGKGGKGSYNFFIFKVGTTRMRPLPVGEDVEFGVDVESFFFGKEIGGVISPRSFGERCAIYEYWEKCQKSKDEKLKKFSDTWKPSRKVMVPHIRYEDELGKQVDPAGAKLAQLTRGQYQKLIDLYLDADNGDFSNPIKGYDIKYKRTGTTKMDTEYTLLPGKPSKLPEEFRKKIFNPEKMVRAIMPSYEETKNLLDKFLNNSAKGTSEDSSSKKTSTKVKVLKKKKKLKARD